MPVKRRTFVLGAVAAAVLPLPAAARPRPRPNAGFAGGFTRGFR